MGAASGGGDRTDINVTEYLHRYDFDTFAMSEQISPFYLLLTAVLVHSNISFYVMYAVMLLRLICCAPGKKSY